MWAIYFDTNPLKASGWPRVSVGLRRAIDLAHFIDIPLFVPEPVEIELEEAWVRDFREKTASIGSRHRDLGKHTANIVEVGAVPDVPNEAAGREAYRRVAAATKGETGIESIPTTTRPIRYFVELAARRRRPFNEKGHGFRDSVILSTILAHAPAHDIDHCALVTLDSDFEGPEVQADFEAAGVHLHIYSVNQLVDALNEGLEAANREDVAREHAAARSTIEGNRADIERAIGDRLIVFDFDLRPPVFMGTVRRLERIEVGKILSIQTPFPIPAGEERVAVSFEAEVKLHSLGESYNVKPPQQMKVGEEPKAPDPDAPFMLTEPIVVTQTAEVETTAIRTADGRYRDIQVEAAKLKRSFGGLGLGLLGLSLGPDNG